VNPRGRTLNHDSVRLECACGKNLCSRLRKCWGFDNGTTWLNGGGNVSDDDDDRRLRVCFFLGSFLHHVRCDIMYNVLDYDYSSSSQR
jgi:hypothetical protein